MPKRTIKRRLTALDWAARKRGRYRVDPPPLSEKP
jgi:hypothetical protein